MILRRVSLAMATVCVPIVAACDAGPSGPGALVVAVEGDALGGVTLEIAGPGILGFEGLSSTQVYSAPLVAPSDAYRVILIHPEGGALRFEIQVEDLDVEDPAIHVVSAAGADNMVQSAGAVEIRIER